LSEPLQFDSAEPQGAPAAVACANCAAAIRDAYHMANQTVLCERCRRTLEREWQSGSGAGRFGRALVLGAGGAALGALVYYAVLAITRLEIGLIAILVGWLVGRAVRKGSNERGGLKYQLLAVGLTYLAIVTTYIPFIRRAVDDQVSGLALLVLAAISPFVAGIRNIIGLLIIGFALYQAWIMNRRAQLQFSGPYQVGSGAA
jgi:hypothetical protein